MTPLPSGVMLSSIKLPNRSRRHWADAYQQVDNTIPVDLFLPGIMGSPVEYIYSTGLPKTRHFAPAHCVDDLNCAFLEA